MPIELKESERAKLAAMPEVVADKLWMLSLRVSTPSPQSDGVIEFCYAPWSGDKTARPVQRDNDGNDLARTVSTPLWSTSAQVPELYTAILAILAAIPAVITHLDEVAANTPPEVTE